MRKNREQLEIERQGKIRSLERELKKSICQWNVVRSMGEMVDARRIDVYITGLMNEYTQLTGKFYRIDSGGAR